MIIADRILLHVKAGGAPAADTVRERLKAAEAKFESLAASSGAGVRF